jgi:hypothetical protein
LAVGAPAVDALLVAVEALEEALLDDRAGMAGAGAAAIVLGAEALAAAVEPLFCTPPW